MGFHSLLIHISGMFFCSTDACSITFDNEEQLIEHEEKAEHVYTEQSTLSTMDRTRYTYIEHLKGARLVDDKSNAAAIQSYQKSNIVSIQFKYNNDELNRMFLTQGYAIRRRQIKTKITQEHQAFFTKLFREGENTGKKLTVENALQEMCHAVKSDNSKLFTTKQYLTKNQIRGLFGRLAKKGSLERRSRWIQNNEKDKSSITSDEDEAEDYFTMQQNRELDDLKVDEVNNASSCCSDGEDGTSSINEN